MGWSPVSPLLATASGACIVAWDFTGENPSRHPREVSCEIEKLGALAFTREGLVVAGGEHGSIALVDCSVSASVVARREGLGRRVCAVAAQPLGDGFVASCAGGVAQAFRVNRVAGA